MFHKCKVITNIENKLLNYVLCVGSVYPLRQRRCKTYSSTSIQIVGIHVILNFIVQKWYGNKFMFDWKKIKLLLNMLTINKFVRGKISLFHTKNCSSENYWQETFHWRYLPNNDSENKCFHRNRSSLSFMTNVA